MSTNENNQIVALCDIYIAIVIDESGSIYNSRSSIVQGLKSFINSQINSNIKLSFIGMSDSDTDLRTDHIIEKSISGFSSLFIDWLDAYQNRRGLPGIGSGSDYWSSGLRKAKDLGTSSIPNTLTPDIVIVITDGLEINDRTLGGQDLLSTLLKSLNSKTHVFVYGLQQGFYETPVNIKETSLVNALNYYLGRVPIKLSDTNSLLKSDYDSNITNFSQLNVALNNLASELVASQIGCIPNVEISENHLMIPSNLNVGQTITLPSDSYVVLKNKSRVALTLQNIKGSKIHKSADVGGVIFKVKSATNNIIINPNSETKLYVETSGIITSSGTHFEKIFIDKVNNEIFNFKIEFTTSSSTAKLVLENHSISPLDFYVNEAIISTDIVGYLYISNTGGSSATIQRLTSVIETTAGVVYKTGDNPITIDVGAMNVQVPIYVSGNPSQIGPFNPEIKITSPFVDNTVKKLKITFNIKGKPNLQVKSHNIEPQNFTLGASVAPYKVGEIVIYNAGTSVGEMMPALQIIENPNGVVYKTEWLPTYIPISPGASASIPVFASADSPSPTGEYLKRINISNSRPVSNPYDLKIAFNIVKPILKVVSGASASLTAGGNYPHISVTSFEIQNLSSVPCSFTDIKIHSSFNIAEGLVFTASTSSYNGPIQPGKTASVNVYVDGMATQALANYSELIVMEVPGFIVENDQFNLNLNVAQENFKVEVLNDLVVENAFIKDLSVSERSVGFLQIQNKTLTRSFTLEAETVIHSHSSAYGLTFKTKRKETFNANQAGPQQVEIVVVSNSGASHEGTGLNVKINIASVDGKGHQIIFNVQLEPINARITASTLESKTFTKGMPVSLNDIYGYITITNDTKTRPVDIIPGTILWIYNGFTFRILEKSDNTNYKIPALSDGYIPIAVSASNTMQSQDICAEQAINIINPPIQNPQQQYKIDFCVIDEPMDVRITKYTPEAGGNIYIQGLPTIGKQSFKGGKIEITNFTSTRTLNLTGNIEIGITNGLTFYLSAGRTVLGPQEKHTFSIIAKSTSGAINLGDQWKQTFNDLIFWDIRNPQNFELPFKVVLETFNVHLTEARFDLFGLKKGVPITGDRANRIGIITLHNKSQARKFTLYPNTIIHSSESVDGLVFLTANTTPIEIDIEEIESVYIKLKPSNTTPINLGSYKELITIDDVKNPIDSFLETFYIEFDVMGDGISVDTDNNTSLQSPDFTLLSAGSKGIDSTKGNHLRWTFAGNLGEKHLPKGGLETNTINFNKPNDYVKVYRAPYIEQLSSKYSLDLSQRPTLLDDSKQCWIYKINLAFTGDDIPAKSPTKEKIFYVYFRNQQQYREAKERFDPFLDTLNFITAYGENIIEIEIKDELFFKVTLPTTKLNNGDLLMEILSVEENKLVTSKYLSYRKRLSSQELRGNHFLAENGRSVRLKKLGSPLLVFEFEFYSDFISSASYFMAWEPVGDFGLIKTDRLGILNQLLGDIDGKWLRYNEGEYVRKQNYIDKWNYTPVEITDMRKGIREIVEEYIRLSSSDNPRAEDYVDYNFSDPDPSDGIVVPSEKEGTLISYLDLLNIAAIDYHVARLLGLGTLDVSSAVLSGNEYIYLTEYVVLKDPKNETVTLAEPRQLLSMSLPTSINTERPAVAIEISELYKGIPKKQNDDIPILYDNEGYTFDGKSRFISIINKPIPSSEINPAFFPNQTYWDASQYTVPVYAGLEYRIVERKVILEPSESAFKLAIGTPVSPDLRPIWKKPELSHDIDYRNSDASGNITSFETIPIMLPESYGEPLYVHRQIATGNYYYATYGINIFSRATTSNLSLNISTTIKPTNTLLPPSEVKTWLIQEEKPLMFTSEFEQEKYNELAEADDKTLVRINFSYNAVQDMIIHPLPLDSGVDDDEYITNTDDYFPDKYDVFADEIEVYFRKDVPRKISAALYAVEQDNDNLCVIFKTKDYILASSGENLESKLPPGMTAQSFVGSLFLVNDKSYVIRNINSGSQGLIFTVYKEEVSRTILEGGSIAVSFSTLTMPETSRNDLFVVMENMQSNSVWGNYHKVPLRFPHARREIITKTSEGGSIQKYLEKSRGFWINAQVNEYLERSNSNNPIADSIHKGIYKVIISMSELDMPIIEFETGFLDFNNGSVRIFRSNSIVDRLAVESRENLKVISTKKESDGTIILYIYDSAFRFDDEGNPSNDQVIALQTGAVTINYYPSYFLYLYKTDNIGLTKNTVLPLGDENVKYSIFGLRSVDTNFNVNGNLYKSKYSAPSLMAGQKVIDPAQPEQPKGSLYATRPDFYGKSTYTFTTKFMQRPYSIQFCRTDNSALLNALYDPETIERIYNNLTLLGGNDEKYMVNRWENFFDYDYLKLHGVYDSYPKLKSVQNEGVTIREGDSNLDHIDQPAVDPVITFAFPLPNNKLFFKGINDFIRSHKEAFGTNDQLIPIDDPDKPLGQLPLNSIIIEGVIGMYSEILLVDFVSEVVDNSFVPLTELPLIYQHLKTYPYLPVNKKQNIRDNSGYLLSPNSEEFDMAPMLTILDNRVNDTLFTDFTLTGTSGNLYFYASREVGSQMTAGKLSKPIGPVKTVDSNIPDAPKIASSLPILENKVLGIQSKIKIEVIPYPEIYRIERINLYRTSNRLDAESVLSMELVKQLEILEVETSETGTWIIYDDLESYEQIPYGETLFYRITVEKNIQYADPQVNVDGTQNIINDYTPSQASKILALMLTETGNPEAPSLEGRGTRSLDADTVNNVTLHWNVTCYKGIYHLYSMSPQGNWKKIARFLTNNMNDKVQFQVYNPNSTDNVWEDKALLNIIDSQISLDTTLLGSDYNQFALFDGNNNRKYYHFRVVAENTSNMFSTQDNILTLFSDDIWDNLHGISSDGQTNGMILGKTFIIK